MWRSRQPLANLAASLRRAADRGQQRDRAGRKFDVLLLDRVAAVRPELLELADSLERSREPNPAAVADLRRLLTDGCRSPLYNPDIHISELRATLYYLRAGLAPGEKQTPSSACTGRGSQATGQT